MVKTGSAAKSASKRRRFDGPIHARLAALRVAHRLNQVDVAKVLKVDATLVSHWETGLARPAVTDLPKLAKLYKTTVTDLIRGEPTYQAMRAVLGAA